MAIRIGIVDNDPYALKVFRAMIERMAPDFEVVWTTNLGAVAISRCLSPAKRPDVLVTDMSMGDVPGTEVCRAIRAKTPEVGLVGVTSYALASFRDEAARCGAQALVGKTDLDGLALAIRGAAQGLPTNPVEALRGRRDRPPVARGRRFRPTRGALRQGTRHIALVCGRADHQGGRRTTRCRRGYGFDL